MKEKPAVYLLTDKHNGALYTGVTKNLMQRVHRHKKHTVTGFTRRYDSNLLVYYELYQSMDDAIRRKNEIKVASRGNKIGLVESINPGWRDLYHRLLL